MTKRRIRQAITVTIAILVLAFTVESFTRQTTGDAQRPITIHAAIETETPRVAPEVAEPIQTTTATETPRVEATEPPAATIMPEPYEPEPVRQETPPPEPEPAEPPYTEDDIIMLAKTVWGEARGCTQDEQRLVVWTVLQRVDHPDRYGNTIQAVVTAYRQFVGYRTRHPVCPDIYALVAEELYRWWNGEEPPTHPVFAPTAPYFYFDGDGQHNWFRTEWRP